VLQKCIVGTAASDPRTQQSNKILWAAAADSRRGGINFECVFIPGWVRRSERWCMQKCLRQSQSVVCAAAAAVSRKSTPLLLLYARRRMAQFWRREYFTRCLPRCRSRMRRPMRLIQHFLLHIMTSSHYTSSNTVNIYAHWALSLWVYRKGHRSLTCDLYGRTDSRDVAHFKGWTLIFKLK
jgi:hypothetical protein